MNVTVEFTRFFTTGGEISRCLYLSSSYLFLVNFSTTIKYIKLLPATTFHSARSDIVLRELITRYSGLEKKKGKKCQSFFPPSSYFSCHLSWRISKIFNVPKNDRNINPMRIIFGFEKII